MAYLTNLSLQVVDRNGAPKTDVGAMISYVGGATIESGNAAGGVYQFTGLVAGLYDVSAIVNGVNYTTHDYQIKNEFLIPIGESSVAAEARTYIRSEESVTEGNLQQDKTVLTGTPTSAGYVNKDFALAFPTSTGTNGVLTDRFTDTIGLAKQTGNSYYSSNQNTTFSQKLRISVA